MSPYKSYRNQPLSGLKRSGNRIINKRRVTVEQIIGRIKQFQAVKQKWRHRRSKQNIIHCML